jgi:hypothetical protein
MWTFCKIKQAKKMGMLPTWGLALLGQDVVTSTSATWHLQLGLDDFQFGF